MTFPADGNTYVPQSTAPESPDIDYVREHGEIVFASTRDGVCYALVRWVKNLTVGYCRCILTPDGKIDRFAPYPVNRYCRVNPVPGKTNP